MQWVCCMHEAKMPTSPTLDCHMYIARPVARPKHAPITRDGMKMPVGMRMPNVTTATNDRTA